MFALTSTAGLGALRSAREAVAGLDQDVPDAVRIDRIRSLEELRSTVAAAQAVETAAFAASQRAAQIAKGVPADRAARGVSAQVGLARRVSPHEAARYVGQASILTSELPQTFARVRSGQVPEWRALLVARQTAWLSAEDRALADAEVAPQLPRLGNQRTVDAVNAIAYRLDPHGYVDRLAHAENERQVSLRPAPESMARLSALLPMKQGVAAYAALKALADSTAGVGGETRNRSQLMADTLVERVTGQAAAGDVPVEVNLVMTDQALLSYGPGSEEPAQLVGGGTIPAELARRMVLDPSDETAMHLRRLFTHPRTGQLAAMDTTARYFTANQRKFLILRDQVCRTPWCNAPIRHADHIIEAALGGATCTASGQGLCEACNHNKQADGWAQEAASDGTVVTITPTGHRYASREPHPPGWRPPRSPVESMLGGLILTAA